MKRATRGFSEEIGRGGHGVVYKGILPDHRVAAIKWFNKANKGEDEFLTEVSTIGRLNHMNLVEMWGYCAERKHRLLVYEYMEHGSLEKNLYSNKLDYDKRFNIAASIAKGLAYLHEECLEWVPHCDVKPQNILLDTNYQPKKDTVVQHLYMGRSPPVFTEMRVLHQTTDDDHLVLELGMNFRTADDMSAILAVKLSKRLGFGMRAKLHLMGMLVEGKMAAFNIQEALIWKEKIELVIDQ
ncbi:putative receptor protein kinase ZmPK1, partial [Camellia sinensis]|uniref:putative receptor protein kinase ZmPK1 n=1 Tax=Camellia sinensis TaxID=4442 RepID=UPI001035E912